MVNDSGTQKMSEQGQRNDAQHFWDGTRDGILRVKKCCSCGETHHYPRSNCPFCGSGITEWVDCSGAGTVYSFSITRVKGKAPIAIAYVSLPEGVTMLTNIVDTDIETLQIGDAVTAVFPEQNGGNVLPLFTRA